MATGKPLKAILMRGLALACFLCAAIVMFLSKEKVDVESSKLIVKYFDWRGFVMCVVVNLIGCFYNFIVLFIPAGSQLWKTVVFLDVIMNILVGASLGAGWQTYCMINEGNISVRWCAICGGTPSFCSKILGSLIITTFGFFFSILLQMNILHVTVDLFW